MSQENSGPSASKVNKGIQQPSPVNNEAAEKFIQRKKKVDNS